MPKIWGEEWTEEEIQDYVMDAELNQIRRIRRQIKEIDNLLKSLERAKAVPQLRGL